MSIDNVNIPMSGEDIIIEMNGKVDVYSYFQILDFKNIDELLGKYKKVVLLYHTSSNYGHWCCLYENNKQIYFFDSYGLKPDAELNFIPHNLRNDLNQHHKYLTLLLYNSKKIINYNQYQLQKVSPNIQTCGRWCCLRLQYPEISVNEFKNIFDKTSKLISNDHLVTLLI